MLAPQLCLYSDYHRTKLELNSKNRLKDDGGLTCTVLASVNPFPMGRVYFCAFNISEYGAIQFPVDVLIRVKCEKTELAWVERSPYIGCANQYRNIERKAKHT